MSPTDPSARPQPTTSTPRSPDPATVEHRGLLLNYATAYRNWGWSVIPVHGKRATIRTWNPYRRRLPTDDELREWFSGGHHATGLAVICGAVSGGLAVRDFDDEGAYLDWAKGHRHLASTLPTVKTRRGMHVYLRAPGSRTRRYPDGELRGEGGYVIAPPSKHPDGGTYEWVNNPSGMLPEVDLGGADLVPNPKNVTHAVFLAVSQGCMRGCIPDQAVQIALPTGPGQRNRCLLTYARAVKFHVGVTDSSDQGLEPLFDLWWQKAQPLVRTKDRDTSWQDFLTAFDNARQPLGVVDTALALATSEPPPVCAQNYKHDGMKKLVQILASLQRVVGDKPFSASASQVAVWVWGEPPNERARQRHRVKANRWLWKLIHDGVLVMTRRGSQGAKGGLASEYRWRGGPDNSLNTLTNEDTKKPPHPP